MSILEANKYKKQIGKKLENNIISKDFKSNPTIWKIFHKSNLPKFGFNPKTEFWTPYGIYFYPSTLLGGGRLPFRNEAAYTHFAEIKDEYKDKILIIGYSDDETQGNSGYNISNWEEKLRNLFEKYRSLDDYNTFITNKSMSMFSDRQKIYFGIRNCSWQEEEQEDGIGNNVQAAVEFRKHLIEFGILGVLDKTGTIHENEPEQCLILSKEIIDYKGYEAKPNADKIFLAAHTKNHKVQEKLLRYKGEEINKSIKRALFLNPNLSEKIVEKFPYHVMCVNPDPELQIKSYSQISKDSYSKNTFSYSMDIFSENRDISVEFIEYFIKTNPEMFLKAASKVRPTQINVKALEFITNTLIELCIKYKKNGDPHKKMECIKILESYAKVFKNTPLEQKIINAKSSAEEGFGFTDTMKLLKNEAKHILNIIVSLERQELQAISDADRQAIGKKYYAAEEIYKDIKRKYNEELLRAFGTTKVPKEFQLERYW